MTLLQRVDQAKLACPGKRACDVLEPWWPKSSLAAHNNCRRVAHQATMKGCVTLEKQFIYVRLHKMWADCALPTSCTEHATQRGPL